MEHPRVYGENEGRDMVERLLAGTSPRVRGKPQAQASRGQRRRNIPACTGKTWPKAQPSRSLTEHPRVYGENA